MELFDCFTVFETSNLILVQVLMLELSSSKRLSEHFSEIHHPGYLSASAPELASFLSGATSDDPGVSFLRDIQHPVVQLPGLFSARPHSIELHSFQTACFQSVDHQLTQTQLVPCLILPGSQALWKACVLPVLCLITDP